MKRCLLLGVAAILLACSTPTEPVRAVPTGSWASDGDPQYELRVSSSSSFFHDTWDCFLGTIDGPLTTDAKGGFEATGSFMFARSAPFTETVRGQLNGSEMSLSLRGQLNLDVVLRLAAGIRPPGGAC